MWPRRGAQRSKYDDGSGPVPGEALAAVRATYDRALAFMANVHEPIMNAARMAFYYVAKSLMVDEASTGLQHVEAVLGKGCAGRGGPQLPGYRSDSSTVTGCTANCGVSTPTPSQVLL